MFQQDQRRYKCTRLPTEMEHTISSKSPRKLKEDVSQKFPNLFLERKQNRDKIESMYENKPQMAVGGTKHTIITDTNEIIHRKRASKPINQIFQNPLSRRGENARGKDGRFTTTEQQEENINTAEHSERCSTPVLEESVLNNTLTPMTPELDLENRTISPLINHVSTRESSCSRWHGYFFKQIQSYNG